MQKRCITHFMCTTHKRRNKNEKTLMSAMMLTAFLGAAPIVAQASDITSHSSSISSSEIGDGVNAIQALFTDTRQTALRASVTQSEIDQVREHVSNLSSEAVKPTLFELIDKAQALLYSMAKHRHQKIQQAQ